MPAYTSNLSRPVFFGFGIGTLRNTEPRIEHYPIDSTSAPIRWGDPVREISGGTIVRAAPNSTSYLGIAAQGDAALLPSSFAQAPPITDAAGNHMMPVYMFDADTNLVADCNTVPSIANRSKSYDFMYAAVAPSLTLTTVGTAGSTTIAYKCTAMTINGESAGVTTSITTANAALDGTNYVHIVIPFVNRNVFQFGIYRANVLIAIVPAAASGNTTYDDKGTAAIGGAAPTVDMTGWLIDLGNSSVAVANIVRLDDRPELPIGSGRVNQRVEWRVPSAKSQAQDVTGS